MGLTVTTAPTQEPVPLAELKAALQVEHTADDDEIAAIGMAARDEVETQTRRQLMPATYTLTLDYFPCEIELPRSPVQSVTSITYLDSDGTSQTLATSVYAVDTTCLPPRIRLRYDQTWPTTRSIENAVTVVFIAGYSATNPVPAPLRQAIKMRARQMYDPEFVGAQNKDSAWERSIRSLERTADTGQFI